MQGCLSHGLRAALGCIGGEEFAFPLEEHLGVNVNEEDSARVVEMCIRLLNSRTMHERKM